MNFRCLPGVFTVTVYAAGLLAMSYVYRTKTLHSSAIAADIVNYPPNPRGAQLGPEMVLPLRTYRNLTKSQDVTGCGHARIIESPVDLRVSVLASFPGSGNTWMRYLLTTATGLKTGTVYTPGFKYETANRCWTHKCGRRVVVVKAHLGPDAYKLNPDRCLLLIRNPYEAILAEFNRQGNGPNQSVHHYYATTESFTTRWPTFVTMYMRRWRDIYTSWADSQVPVYVLVYHRLVTNLEEELRRLFRFLNEPSVTPQISCVVQRREGSHHRKKKLEQMQLAVFSDQQVEYLDRAIMEVKLALERKTGKNFSDFTNWMRSTSVN